jgi:methylthioribose-1-phosphate isomerase
MNTSKIVNNFHTLRWSEGALEMLDQRALPNHVEYRRYDSANAVADGIKDMVVRGAPAIGCASAYGVALEALRLQNHARDEFLAGIEKGMAALSASRPTAVNLFWALNRMRGKLAELGGQNTSAIADALLAEAHAISDEDVRQNRMMGQYGAALLADNMRVLTHCNAGALATAGHGTALGVIRSAVEAGKKIPCLSGCHTHLLDVVGRDFLA